MPTNEASSDQHRFSDRERRLQRLFVADDLTDSATVACSADQAHYLLRVLRRKAGAHVLVFNGRQGEWLAELRLNGKRACDLVLLRQTRAQVAGPDLVYLFAPLKKGRLDYMVQKAAELGVAALQPVLTEFTQAERVNLERMQANAIEAAEQCGILWSPEIRPAQRLADLLSGWDTRRTIIFCDEGAQVSSPLEALACISKGPLAVLIGPEGGFSETERAMLAKHESTVAISLGPRIMRADTAAVAALALVNAVLGDWR